MRHSIDAAHARYLEDGRCLIHGDVQPANVLLSATGPKLLDAEIARFGDPAFDIGQLLGQLLLPAAAGRYAGIELLRRTLGAARAQRFSALPAERARGLCCAPDANRDAETEPR